MLLHSPLLAWLSRDFGKERLKYGGDNTEPYKEKDRP